MRISLQLSQAEKVPAPTMTIAQVFKYRVATDDGDHETVVLETNDLEEAKAEFTKQCDRFLDDVRKGVWGEDFLEELEDGLTIALEEDLSEVLMEKTFYAEDLEQ